MKIGIDASRAFLRERTGIEEYSYQTIKHLRDPLKDHRVVLYLRRKQAERIDFDLPENWSIKTIILPRFWTQMGLALELLMNPVEVLFVPAHIVPWIHPASTVVTIHGLEYEFMPEAYSLWERLYMRFSIKLSCRWAKKIVAVSKNTKADLEKLYEVPEEKVTVIYEGYDTKHEARSTKDEADGKHQTPDEKYLLFIGRLEKRKNVAGIIEAFEILKEKYNIPHKLILAGRPGYGYEEIQSKIKFASRRTNFNGDIIEKGYVSEEEKASLLANADIFLFPTFYEGFGLPILEAQAAGVPVVTSNVSSLPEIAGDGALYADPREISVLAETINTLINDKDLRSDIIKKGQKNLERFDWNECATQIAEILVGE